jgi:hypothetical protein
LWCSCCIENFFAVYLFIFALKFLIVHWKKCFFIKSISIKYSHKCLVCCLTWHKMLRSKQDSTVDKQILCGITAFQKLCGWGTVDNEIKATDQSEIEVIEASLRPPQPSAIALYIYSNVYNSQTSKCSISRTSITFITKRIMSIT